MMKRKMQTNLNRNAGFSLLEILVAMAIMAILTGVMVINFGGKTDEANLQRLKSDFAALNSALIQYKADNFLLPTTEQGLEALVTRPTSDPTPKNYQRDGYLQQLQNDPWGNPYQYVYPGENGRYDIYSLGADGEEGGEDLAADIGNWNIDEAIKALKEQN